jgi:hypothetical protein
VLDEFRGHAAAMRDLAVQRGMTGEELPRRIEGLIAMASDREALQSEFIGRGIIPGDRLRTSPPGGATRVDPGVLNASLMRLSRMWMEADGIPGRPWFKNWYVSNDEDSGYANWMLPGLRKPIQDGDVAGAVRSVEVYRRILER